MAGPVKPHSGTGKFQQMCNKISSSFRGGGSYHIGKVPHWLRGNKKKGVKDDTRRAKGAGT